MTLLDNKFPDRPDDSDGNADRPPTEIITIRPETEIQTRQQLPYQNWRVKETPVEFLLTAV